MQAPALASCVLLVMDYDLGHIACWPPFGPVEQSRQLALATIGAASCDPRIGIRPPHHLRNVTRQRPEGVVLYGAPRPLAERRSLMVHSYRSFGPRALEMSLTDPEQAQPVERAWLQARVDECYV